MDTKKIGKVVKRSRQARGLTEYALAKATGLKIDTVKSIEAGNGFNIIKLLRICAHLNIEIRLIQKILK